MDLILEVIEILRTADLEQRLYVWLVLGLVWTVLVLLFNAATHYGMKVYRWTMAQTVEKEDPGWVTYLGCKWFNLSLHSDAGRTDGLLFSVLVLAAGWIGLLILYLFWVYVLIGVVLWMALWNVRQHRLHLQDPKAHKPQD